ncbi:sperm-associated antigen 5-like [Candoia aspera]|uniref:sperm-associated antigen 5-like n=1 Tax=Candoia aspera TaxID=51853 RepID=UPI002FD819AA
MAESGGLSGRGQDTAASSAQAGHNGSPGLGTISWTAPLAWLEQVLPSSPMLADLRRSLPIVAFQQEKGNPLTPKPRATASILPGSDGSLCMQQKDPALPQDQCTSTPISVASAGVWASPVSCQDSGPKMPLEQGPDPLEQVGPITSPFLAAPGCPEADATASPEGQDSPALCLDPGTAHVSPVSCRCHSLWGSPLSLLDDGLNVSLAGKAPSWQGAKGVSANPSCLACAQVCTPLSSLPAVSQQDQGTSITPLSVASVAAWTSQLSLREAGVNTSPAEKATTDSTAETDSLLWHCSRDQLSHLSRAELEGRLESTLIIMEALSRQIRAGQELWRPAAQLGPAEQRDAATQTPASESREEEQVYCDLYVELRQRFWSLQQSQKSRQKLAQRLESASEEMATWSSESRRLQAMVEASFLRLQEDRQSLCQQQKQAGSLLSQCRAQLQRWGQKHGEMARGLEAALKAKDAANLVQESVQARAAAQIRTLELSAESRRSLWALLQEAKRLKADLCSGYTKHVEDGDRLAAALQADWAQMRLDYEGCRSTIAKCLTVARRMEKEVEAARCEGARHQEARLFPWWGWQSRGGPPDSAPSSKTR